MPQSNSSTQLCIAKLILIPSVITLAITLLRLVGELQHWSKTLFNPHAGGGGAIIAIAWLPFIFGPYFAIKLAHGGQGPASTWKTIGMALVGVAAFPLGAFLAFGPKAQFLLKMPIGLLIMVLAAAIQYFPWPALFKTLLAYAYAARVPVVVVMFFAIQGSWGTHYDFVPRAYTGPSYLVPKWLYIGVRFQLVFWVVYTVVLGTLLGGIAASVARRAKPAPQPAA